MKEFEPYRLKFDDMIHTGDIEPGLRDLRALPAAQPRAHRSTRSTLLQTEPDWTLDEIFEFDRKQAPLAGRPGAAWTSCGASA